MELEIEQFNPTIAELKALVEDTKRVDCSDLSNKVQVGIVKATRIALGHVRVKIEKRGKQLREEANAFNKAVISKQNELIAIIEPEEKRLEMIEDDAALHAVMEERRRKLPTRIERIRSLEFGDMPSEQEIISMDDVLFEQFWNVRLNAKNAAEAERIRLQQEQITAEQNRRQAELDAKEAKVHEAELKIKREKELEVAKEKARVEGEMAAEAKRERQEMAERTERENKENEARAAVAKLEKTKKYQSFLKEIGYEETSDFQRTETPTEVIVWKKIGTFKK